MIQKIDLSNIPAVKEPDFSDGNSFQENCFAVPEKQSDTFEENLQYLIMLYPDKILFCIKEASCILGQSYEFVRLKIHEGKISVKSYGSRKMIHRLEVARLITEGL